MDILLWGLTSIWIRQNATNVPNVVVILLSGLVFWQVVWRAQYEFTVNLLEEMWSHNFVNLFATPLKISEWLVATLILGVSKMILSVSFAVGLVYFLYAVKLWDIGLAIIPFFVLLLMMGWWVGFFISGFIMRYGTRIQTIAWSGVYLLAPFSAIYYPLNVLPEWAQHISWWIPASHIFEGLRLALLTRQIDTNQLLIALIQNVIYLTISTALFLYMFKKTKENGLASIE
jgi:ABC-2 type transport system permease protein